MYLADFNHCHTYLFGFGLGLQLFVTQPRELEDTELQFSNI